MATMERAAVDEDEAAVDRQTSSLAGLAVVLMVVVLGLQLVRVLTASAIVEDCLMAGRRNCDALVSTSGAAPQG